jgi:hypothetical protein
MERTGTIQRRRSSLSESTLPESLSLVLDDSESSVPPIVIAAAVRKPERQAASRDPQAVVSKLYRTPGVCLLLSFPSGDAAGISPAIPYANPEKLFPPPPWPFIVVGLKGWCEVRVKAYLHKLFIVET